MNVQKEIIDAMSVLAQAATEDATTILMGVVSSVIGNKCVVTIHGKNYNLDYYNGVPTVGEKIPVFVPYNNMASAFVLGKTSGGTGGVSSVNGKTGAVVLVPSDIGAVSTSDYDPDSKTSSMTQSVGVDSDGKLWTAPGGGSGNIPTGGTTGQVLKKQSNTDYDVIWANESITVYPTSLVITAPPTKTQYSVGESFSNTGMVVSVEYNTKALRTVTGYTWSPSGALTINDTYVTISYTENGYTVTAQQSISVDSGKVYGVMWNYSSSSTALTRLTASTDPNGYVNTTVTTAPNPAVGTASGTSPFDTLYPWSGIDEYNIINNVVSYRKGDTGFSRTAYDTMVYIPEFYYKVVDDSTNSKRYFYVASGEKTGFTKHPGSGRYVGRYTSGSDYTSKSGYAPVVSMTRATARTNSRAKGSSWQQYDIATWSAIGILYLVEFANWNSQLSIGKGYTNGSAAINSGGTDSMTYHTGRAAGTDNLSAVQYRHIENLWGNVWQWVDGINFYDRAAYVCTDPQYYADDTSTNYTATGITVASTDGYITQLGYSADAEFAFLPTAAGTGSDTGYVPDKIWSDTGWQTLNVGGRWTNINAAGLFAEDVQRDSSGYGEGVSSRLLYIPS